MNSNKIETIHPKTFWSSLIDSRTSHTRLEYLNLRNNNIDYIKSGTFDPLFNLTNINLHFNKITNIEQKLFINIPKIWFIDISKNTLTNLPITWLPYSLIRLNIINNGIKRLTSDTFLGAINLVELWLSPQHTTIDYNTFADLSKLINIHVRNYGDLEIICDCDYIWYLNTNSNSIICTTEDNEIRKYLEENCKTPC